VRLILKNTSLLLSVTLILRCSLTGLSSGLFEGESAILVGDRVLEPGEICDVEVSDGEEGRIIASGQDGDIRLEGRYRRTIVALFCAQYNLSRVAGTYLWQSKSFGLRFNNP